MIDDKLKQIAQSYDYTIELGKQGIDPYQELPAFITGDPDYLLYQKEAGASAGSGNIHIKEFLSPQSSMAFVDLGCCLNFMFRNYSTWPSLYHGVDISRKTIRVLQDYALEKQLPFGEFYCGSIHKTPFADNFFDIGACIGVLEYFQEAFVEKALAEAHRILKSDGKFVLDIPNMGTPACRIMMMVEAYMGRPDTFDLPAEAFEEILQKYFLIIKKEAADTGMLQYYLQRK